MSDKENHKQGRGELYSYRIQPEYQKDKHGKILTSPSHSNEKDKWTEEVETLFLFEKKG